MDELTELEKDIGRIAGAPAPDILAGSPLNISEQNTPPILAQNISTDRKQKRNSDVVTAERLRSIGRQTISRLANQLSPRELRRSIEPLMVQSHVNETINEQDSLIIDGRKNRYQKWTRFTQVFVMLKYCYVSHCHC
eukprot:UN23331